MKRQISIHVRDDIIQREDEDMGFTEVSRNNSRKNINLNASSPSPSPPPKKKKKKTKKKKKKKTESNHSESQVFAESNDVGHNQQSKES